jgi:hypothetical protein
MVPLADNNSDAFLSQRKARGIFDFQYYRLKKSRVNVKDLGK